MGKFTLGCSKTINLMVQAKKNSSLVKKCTMACGKMEKQTAREYTTMAMELQYIEENSGT